MRTANIDSLRLQVLQEVMNLDEEKLLRLHSTLSALSKHTDTILHELLHDSADEFREDESTYTTDEVMKNIDKEMGWK
ncbi:MAG: hypothetical protein PHO94_03720 [Petrimonas sp.]|nr:hypothetical protein [Petrimonas sp.]